MNPEQNGPQNKLIQKKTSAGSDIFVVDHLPPEANAMAQALYSRDPRSVTIHLDKIAEIGWEKFMASYYVGYGHKSIGDCGTTTIFAENISILAAKAIQDWALYNGQEASTRYLDMTKQKVLNPVGTKDAEKIQNEWMQLYTKVLADLIPWLKQNFPKAADQEEKTYEKAIKAKAFDIARGFLPAGVTTYASWHTNLRQAYDHIHVMGHHPLAEIREVSNTILEALKVKYPSSFSHKTYPEQEAYLALAAKKTTYYDRAKAGKFTLKHNLNLKDLKKDKDLLKKRPQKTELPQKFLKYGLLTFSFPLDFGSYRDLQRHRNGAMAMPLLSTKHGFYKWYLDQLPTELRKYAETKIKEQQKRIAKLKCDSFTKQYYVALGYTVACDMTLGLPAAVYLAELRSSQTVHPTLRLIAQDMTTAIAKAVPGITLHSDMSKDAWNIKRGTQDIVKK